MIEWIVSASVLIVVVILLRFVLRGKISLRLQYGLWGLVMVRLLLPVPLVSSGMSVMNSVERLPLYQTAAEAAEEIQVVSDVIRNSTLTMEEAEEVGRGTLHRVEGYPVESGREHLHTYSFQDSLAVVAPRVLKRIWTGGAVLLGLWLIATNLHLCVRLRRSRRLLRKMDRGLPVYISDAAETPCLFGLFRPAIYLTEEAAADETVMRHAVEHELTHYRHRDNIWALLRGVCLVIHWYNPLVWWAAVLSGNDAELACDEATILRLGESERAAYGRTLIGLTCEKRPTLLSSATTMNGGGRSIRERIALIARKPKMAVWTLIAVVVIAVVAVGCTFTGSKDQPHSFGEWTESLTAEEIQHAEVKVDEERSAVLDDGSVSEADRGALRRMRELKAEDIRYMSGFSEVDAQALVPLLNNVPDHRIDSADGITIFWEMTLYLSGGPEGYSSEDEYMILYAGYEENIVEILYHDGAGSYSRQNFEDAALYRFISETYRTHDAVDPEAWARYKDILSERAEMSVSVSVENSQEEPALLPFTGYEIVALERVDGFDHDGAQYIVYRWDVAFHIENPLRALWAGGSWLDSERRVRSVEEHTYFVVRASEQTEEYEFFFWDLYFGPDEEIGRENAHATILKQFEER